MSWQDTVNFRTDVRYLDATKMPEDRKVRPLRHIRFVNPDGRFAPRYPTGYRACRTLPTCPLTSTRIPSTQYICMPSTPYRQVQYTVHTCPVSSTCIDYSTRMPNIQYLHISSYTRMPGISSTCMSSTMPVSSNVTCMHDQYPVPVGLPACPTSSTYSRYLRLEGSDVINCCVVVTRARLSHRRPRSMRSCRSRKSQAQQDGH